MENHKDKTGRQKN